jgi:CubicO group peptidase (beta-lactamase class C family)
MKKAIAILSLIGLLGWSCQRSGDTVDYRLPGTAPFLQQDDSLAMATVAAMSLEDKLQQLLLIVVNDTTLSPSDYANYGGYVLNGVPLSVWQKWRQQAQANKAFPSLLYTTPGTFPANQLTDAASFPTIASAQSLQDEAMRQRLMQVYAEQQRTLGMRHAFWVHPNLSNLAGAMTANGLATLANTINNWTDERMLPIVGDFTARHLLISDTSVAFRQKLAVMESGIAAGLAGVHLSPQLLSQKTVAEDIRRFFRQELQFGGLLLAKLEDRAQMDDWLAADVDAFVVPVSEADALLNFLRAAFRKGDLSEARLNDKVRRLLLARQWSQPLDTPVPAPKVPSLEAALFSSKSAEENTEPLSPAAYFQSADWAYWREQWVGASLVLASNPEGTVPLAEYPPIALYEQPPSPLASTFAETLDRYTTGRSVASVNEAQTEELLVSVLYDQPLDTLLAQQLLQQAKQQSVIVVNFGQPDNLALLDTSLTVIQAFGTGELEQSYAAQLIMGGHGASGRLPATYGAYFQVGQGVDTAPIRLGYANTYQVGIAPQRLVGIDAIVASAIDEQAFPGAQLLVAKDGKVIYRKAFGYHTYEQEQPVRMDDYYDLASITKVAATTLAAMQAYETETIELNDRLREHLALSRSSRLRNLRVEKLLSHRTGLQPHLPVIPYLLAREETNADCKRYFCQQLSADYPIEVADSFFFAQKYYDRIWKDMQRLRSRYTRYRYSDANFVLLQRLLEEKAGQRLDSLVAANFYQPLGLRRLTFLPCHRVALNHIIPTELDYRWRHRLIHGNVHDETAALLGGVAGHAGLFGNADDLAVVFQLLLNEGQYGGQRYFEPRTIEKFTTASHGNHRGLGFDKPKPEDIGEAAFPEGLSEATFGHTGFTGTCVWSDPEQQLTYIFLSNRIHPDRNNKKLFELRVRERVHEVIYDALGSYEVEWPRMVATLNKQ